MALNRALLLINEAEKEMRARDQDCQRLDLVNDDLRVKLKELRATLKEIQKVERRNVTLSRRVAELESEYSGADARIQLPHEIMEKIEEAGYIHKTIIEEADELTSIARLNAICRVCGGDLAITELETLLCERCEFDESS